MFHLAVLNALRMSMLINAQNPLHLPVLLLVLVAMSTTAWMALTVDLPFQKPNWFSERLLSRTMWPSSLCRIISSKSFPIVSNRHIGLYDEASPRGLLPFPSRTNLCFFQSAKNLSSQRQELKASRRRSSGYAPITSLRISFGTSSIPGAVFASSLPPALFSSSRVKSSSCWTTQELRSCLWNGSTCGNKLRTIYLTRLALSRPGVFLLVTSLLVTILKVRPHWSFSTSPIKSFQHWSRLFFMPCLRADLTFFYASRSRGSPFEQVNLCRAVRHFRRRTNNWSFHQYIESSVRPCPRRGMECSHAATTFRLFAKLVLAESFCVPGGAPHLTAPSHIHWVTPFLDAELNALVVTQGYYLEDTPVACPWGKIYWLMKFRICRLFILLCTTLWFCFSKSYTWH